MVPEAEQRGFGFNHEPAMDGTMDINATTLEAIAYNLTGTAQVMCSHDGCGVIVSYHESLSHQITCLHGRCTCTEPGCDFAALPSVLVVHLATAHSIQVHRIQYGMSREFRVIMTRLGSSFRHIVVEGEDGSAFVLNIGVLGSATVVSLVRIRVATSAWPLYRVKMWARGPLPSSKADCKRDVMRVAAYASSSVLPGADAVTMTRLGSSFRHIVVEGEDGSVFVLNIGVLGSATVVSLVRVRVATSTWPLYRVKMWVRGPPPSSKADCKRDDMRVAAYASSSALPCAVALEELTSFLVVPGPYLIGAGSSKQLCLYIRICKQM